MDRESDWVTKRGGEKEIARKIEKAARESKRKRNRKREICCESES